MATAILSNDNLAFKNSSGANLATLTSTANTLTLSSATNSNNVIIITSNLEKIITVNYKTINLDQSER